MKILYPSLEQIEEQISGFGHHIVYYFDKLIVGNEMKLFDKKRVNEGFFFDERHCLHLYRDGELKAVWFEFEAADEYHEEVQLGIENYPLEKLVVRKFIAYDEDGQAYYSQNLPVKMIVKKGESR